MSLFSSLDIFGCSHKPLLWNTVRACKQLFTKEVTSYWYNPWRDTSKKMFHKNMNQQRLRVIVLVPIVLATCLLLPRHNCMLHRKGLLNCFFKMKHNFMFHILIKNNLNYCLWLEMDMFYFFVRLVHMKGIAHYYNTLSPSLDMCTDSGAKSIFKILLQSSFANFSTHTQIAWPIYDGHWTLADYSFTRMFLNLA